MMHWRSTTGACTAMYNMHRRCTPPTSRYADDLPSKLALSFALAQSTKLSVHEAQLREMGRQLAPLPMMMAERGEISISERQIMRHIGRLFLQMTAVNLLVS